MTRRPFALPSLILPLDAADARPLYRQLYDEVRRAILAGRLRAGTRLPSTRALAKQLRLSRSTVLNAFELLLTEGYLQGEVGRVPMLHAICRKIFRVFLMRNTFLFP